MYNITKQHCSLYNHVPSSVLLSSAVCFVRWDLLTSLQIKPWHPGIFKLYDVYLYRSRGSSLLLL